jgi:hypothetical protein
MNFFFSYRSNFLKSRLNIPRFNNFGKYNAELKVFEAKINNNSWDISLVNCNFNKDFFFIDESLTNNEAIFFLAIEKDLELIKKNNHYKLLSFNDFTNTSPVLFRSNLKIIMSDLESDLKEKKKFETGDICKKSNGGFSSYQSDYPFSMIVKKGSILSPIINLLSKNNDKNIILIRNIYEKPIKQKFNLFFVDLIQKKVLKKEEIFTNFTNEIIVDAHLIEPNIYIFTDKYLGIPIYLAIKDKHLSFEHTHPPHHYILSGDKFKTITEIKSEVHEIISA